MKRIGITMMMIPIQICTSHVLISNGIEFGSVKWWIMMIVIGAMYAIGNVLALDN